MRVLGILFVCLNKFVPLYGTMVGEPFQITYYKQNNCIALLAEGLNRKCKKSRNRTYRTAEDVSCVFDLSKKIKFQRTHHMSIRLKSKLF